MQHTRRIHLMILLLLALVPVGTGTMLLGNVSGVATGFQLEDALERAKVGARRGATLESMEDESSRTYRDAKKRLQALGRQKREVRLKIGALIHSLKTISNRRDTLLLSQELAVRSYSREQEDFSQFLRFAHVRQLEVASGPARTGWVLRRLLGTSLGESVDSDLRDAALMRAREQILQRLLIAQESDALSRDQLRAAVGPAGDELADLTRHHAELRIQYNAVLRTLDSAQSTLRASAEQLEEIQRDTARVQADILSMQGELDRIDGRLRARAERELVQKGLMEDSPDRFRKKTPASDGQFHWPVKGPVSAGFNDARYRAFFGLPHKGIDIVVPFGTPVGSSADGIVFIVRPGGAKGYTYVLIGHRGGYATVYGHLSQVMVTAGQTVMGGEQIGVSGGTPGTEGAGTMTTGAHLHFEMILRGTHIDPRPVFK